MCAVLGREPALAARGAGGGAVGGGVGGGMRRGASAGDWTAAVTSANPWRSGCPIIYANAINVRLNAASDPKIGQVQSGDRYCGGTWFWQY